MNVVAQLGQRTLKGLEEFGDFCRFSGWTLLWIVEIGLRLRRLRELPRQLFLIGTKSIPVVMITGMFVGMVLAVQAFMQFEAIGMVSRMGTIINLSVFRELGPVLAGIVLAGRVGGGLTAELGTMRVTEQIDALRAMGTDPVRVLVVPRFLACVLIIPLMAVYADVMGVFGGYMVSVGVYGVNASEFWRHAVQAVSAYDVLYGVIKCVFFGAVMCLISCYKGFRCQAGAAGVGRACTESFVASCMAILALDFFVGMILDAIYTSWFGYRSIL